MLDVHVLIHRRTRPDWVQQCCASVAAAAAAAGYPVHTHFIATHGSNLGAERARGYSLGDYPYVTSVDDDDWIDPDAFALLHDSLDRNLPAVTTRQVRHFSDGHTETPTWRNNLRVFQRSLALAAPLATAPVYDSWVMLDYADHHGGVTELAAAPYHVRVTPRSNHRQLLRSNPQAAARLRQLHNAYLSKAAGSSHG